MKLYHKDWAIVDFVSLFNAIAVICFILRAITLQAELTEAKNYLPTFDDLLDAIEWVESRGDANAVGDPKPWGIYIDNYGQEVSKGIEYQAIGAYQIHKIYVDDVNRILSLRGIENAFAYNDRWDKGKSRDMVAVYTEYYGTKAWNKIWDSGQFETTDEREGFIKYYELQTRIHNGGPRGWRKESTKAYWQKVKARLEEKNVKEQNH